MGSLTHSSTQAQSIKNYDFRISRFEIQPTLVYLFRVSFLITLDIYKAYFQKPSNGYKDEEFNFLYEKLLRLYTIEFCNQVLFLSSLLMKWRTLQLTTIIQVAKVSHVLGFVQRN